jgi:spore coat polysaccharide biosynthesis protein SpsF
MKTAIFLSIRNKSKRLPGKHFLKIQGKTTADLLVERIKLAKLPDKIVLCTSVNPDDNALEELSKNQNIECFRGSEDDKLDRYLKAAQKFDIDFILVVDGDDIFCDPEHIDKIIERFQRTRADYIIAKDLPLGATAFGVKTKALKKVCAMKKESDTEVWGGYFTDTNLFKKEYIEPDALLKRPEIRMTLDYEEDFNFFKTIFDKLYLKNKNFTLKDIIELIDKEPFISQINSNAQEKYEQHLKKSASIKI